MTTRVTLAAIAGAHGIGGEVRLKLFAEDLASLKRHQVVHIGDVPFTMTAVRAGGQGAIARFDAIASRDEAEALRGKLVTVDRGDLPPLVEGEFYYADVIGLPCIAADGAALGQVVGIEDYGAGEILDVERADGTRAMIPFRRPMAELAGDRIMINPLFLS